MHIIFYGMHDLDLLNSHNQIEKILYYIDFFPKLGAKDDGTRSPTQDLRFTTSIHYQLSYSDRQPSDIFSLRNPFGRSIRSIM